MKIGETTFKEIDVGLLKQAPYNLAERTTDEEIEHLADSIHKRGVMQNLIVVEPEEDERYGIVLWEQTNQNRRTGR